MCGIVGYVGNQPAIDILIAGLERLEYRGYDSAGIALIHNDDVVIERSVGRLSFLKDNIVGKSELKASQTGIGHTRWATHGGPSEANAHPHRSEALALVHNGIIENYQSIRKDLEQRSYQFSSETDTEVATHLLHSLINQDHLEADAIYELTKQVEGSFAFVAVSKEKPDQLMLARRASPLVIGIGERENFVASDVTALLEYTRKFIYLEDGDYAILNADQVKIFHKGQAVEREIVEVEWDLSQAQRGGFDHFMIKEIYDQPKAVNDTLSGRLFASHSDFKLLELENLENHIQSLSRVKLVACGTAWHAGLIGKHYMESIARVPVDVEVASEFRYQNPIISSDELLICVSQSGETADTLAAIDLVKNQCPKVGITNVLGSSLTRQVDAFLLTQAGPEISVASTKAFVTQALVLYLVALKFAKLKNRIEATVLEQHLDQITHLASLVHEVLQQDQAIANLAKEYSSYPSFFFVGRGVSYPVALEGALKLKEITYKSAQGYPAGELKHGPIALIDPNVATVAVVQAEDPLFSKTLSNLNEIKSREGKILIVTDASEGKLDQLKTVANDVIQVPHHNHFLTPILTTIPLQLFAYHMAKGLNLEIDFPRNLAKSVTVE